MSENAYPELERLSSVSDKSQAIAEFVEWLKYEKKFQICEYEESTWLTPDGEEVHKAGINREKDIRILTEGFQPVHTSIQDLLAEYFKIDLQKVEVERRRVLDDFRRLQESKEIDNG